MPPEALDLTFQNSPLSAVTIDRVPPLPLLLEVNFTLRFAPYAGVDTRYQGCALRGGTSLEARLALLWRWYGRSG